MTQAKRAKALGISIRHLRKLEAQGCPADVAGAREWRAQHVQPRAGQRRTTLDLEDELIAIWRACNAALGKLAKRASSDDIQAAVVAYVRTLRERGVEDVGVERLFGVLCNALGVRNR